MSTEPTILVVGNDSDDRDAIVRTLDSESYRVLASDQSEEAGEHLDRGADVVIIDLQSAAFDALDLLRRWQSSQPQTSFVFITEDRDVTSAVEAMKLGAVDCLVKPVDQEELRMLVAKLLDGQAGTEHDEPHGGRRTRQNIEIPPGTSLEDLQRAAVEQALAQHHGNRTHAAKTLGISVRTLQRKLKSWGIPLAATQHPMASQHFLLTPHESHSPFNAHAH